LVDGDFQFTLKKKQANHANPILYFCGKNKNAI